MSQTSHASRIIGLDMARALAIVGMIVVHMASLLWSTKLVLNGIPAALFAVIAGATLMIIGRRFSLNAWLRIIARGGIIMLIGLAMLPVGGWIQVVLVAMGLTMILVSWVPPLNVWWKVALFIAATAAATVRYAPFTLPQIYPLLAWIAYFLAGMILYEVYLRGTTAEGFAPGRTRAIVRWAFSAVSLVVTGMGMYLRFEPEMPSWPRVGGHTGVLGGDCPCRCRQRRRAAPMPAGRYRRPGYVLPAGSIGFDVPDRLRPARTHRQLLAEPRGHPQHVVGTRLHRGLPRAGYSMEEVCGAGAA